MRGLAFLSDLILNRGLTKVYNSTPATKMGRNRRLRRSKKGMEKRRVVQPNQTLNGREAWSKDFLTDWSARGRGRGVNKMNPRQGKTKGKRM